LLRSALLGASALSALVYVVSSVPLLVACVRRMMSLSHSCQVFFKTGSPSRKHDSPSRKHDSQNRKQANRKVAHAKNRGAPRREVSGAHGQFRKNESDQALNLPQGDSCRSCQAHTSRFNRVCFLDLSEKGVSRPRVTGVRTVATEAKERRFGVSEAQRDKFGVLQKTKRRRRRFFCRLTRK
jgi:hypothetical protein